MVQALPSQTSDAETKVVELAIFKSDTNAYDILLTICFTTTQLHISQYGRQDGCRRREWRKRRRDRWSSARASSRTKYACLCLFNTYRTNMYVSTVIINSFDLIRQAVDAFDSRFTLRALRSTSTLRKSDKFAEAMVQGIRTAFPKPNMGARKVLEEMLPDSVTAMQNGVASSAEKAKEGGEDQQLPEIWAYLGILVQVGDTLGRKALIVLTNAGIPLRLTAVPGRCRLQRELR